MAAISLILLKLLELSMNVLYFMYFSICLMIQDFLVFFLTDRRVQGFLFSNDFPMF